ncbi:MAG: stage III sporulation protein AA, partial [Clostridia bacterium]|nr:stage III sporulation protein AA [Clostridia bacterium]
MKVLDWKQCVLPYLPERVKRLIEPVDAALPVEELRIRLGRPIQLCFQGGERIIRREGGAPAAEREDCEAILQKICAHSLYAWEEELKRGFVTLPGGCRVGLCGGMTAAGGGFLAGDVSGFNFRIARA